MGDDPHERAPESGLRLPGRAGPAGKAVVVVVLATAVLAAGCTGDSDSGGGASSEAESTAATPDADLVLSAEDAPVAATVGERFQSYNVEMVEVTGGNFWAPYGSSEAQERREPVDLGSERLRNLAAELGPAYVRVSGSAANSTYFDVDGTTDGEAPEGFTEVLTTDQWDGVSDFAKAVGAEIVTSFASSAGPRDEDGVWTSDQARDLLAYSGENDVPLAAAEFINEPSLNIGTPSGYSAAEFGRDFEIFRATVEETLPEMRIVGPGAVDDVTPLIGALPPLAAEDMLAEVSPAFDVFSYHFYPKVSERCDSDEGPETALTQEFLSRVDTDSAFYEGLRDDFEPGAPMWVTETAQAACGGDRWASQFVDVFRYLDELGRLALRGTEVVMHNTLASSDYGLIDEDTLEPRPDYWAAVLWQRLMGDRALDLDVSTDDDLAVYAHCEAGTATGAVTYLVLNLSETEATDVATTGGEARSYLLTSDDLLSGDVSLNGEPVRVAEDGSVPELTADDVDGALTVPPASVAFVVVDGASPDGCDADD